MKWPKTLSHFAFYGLYSTPHQWNLGTIQNLLASHHDSLKTLRIGSLNGTDNTPFDFSVLSNLETMHMSAWTNSCTPVFTPSKFLPPKLHTFTWDFTIENQHNEQMTDFVQLQADWLYRLADVAKSRQGALRNIHIVFRPEIHIDYYNYKFYETVRYSWDLMDEVRKKIQPFGISLTYHAPQLTKAEYVELINNARLEAEQMEEDARSPAIGRTLVQS
jgi:hypothetical protein